MHGRINEIRINLIRPNLTSNLASSGNDKHVKLASDLLDLNLIEGYVSENKTFREDCCDKISAKKDQNDGNELNKTSGNDAAVKSSNKRTRSGSNDSVKRYILTKCNQYGYGSKLEYNKKTPK